MLSRPDKFHKCSQFEQQFVTTFTCTTNQSWYLSPSALKIYFKHSNTQWENTSGNYSASCIWFGLFHTCWATN